MGATWVQAWQNALFGPKERHVLSGSAAQSKADSTSSAECNQAKGNTDGTEVSTAALGRHDAGAVGRGYLLRSTFSLAVLP